MFIKLTLIRYDSHTIYLIELKVTQNEEIKMKSLNGACLFAYEVHRILPAKNELEDPKSLPDIQRAIINGTLLNLIQQHVTTLKATLN